MLLGLLAWAASSCSSPPSGPSQGSKAGSFTGGTRISADSPFRAGCNGGTQPGTNFINAEVEPYVASDPTDGNHFIVSFQQDRWGNGGSNGVLTAATFDGGKTWTRATVPVSRCGGGTAANGGGYERASNPWVTISADGKAYLAAIAFDVSAGSDGSTVILVSRSDDGGRTWGDPATLVHDRDFNVLNDKVAVTADPTDPSRAYVVWDRVTGLTQTDAPGSGPALLSILSNGTWSAPATIHDPGLNLQTISNQLVVLPDGTLVEMFLLLANLPNQLPDNGSIQVIRSQDHGATWSAPIEVAELRVVPVTDARTGVPVRAGAFIPEIAVDPLSGALFVVWEDGRFGNFTTEAVALSASVDGGRTWSSPRRINGDSSVPAFEPTVRVGKSGVVAVLYEDLRHLQSGNGTFLATYWLATSSDGGASFTEQQQGSDFDLSEAFFGPSYFLGDYQGLAATADGFLPVLAATNRGNTENRTDLFAGPF